jgi:hypothetical protein
LGHLAKCLNTRNKKSEPVNDSLEIFFKEDLNQPRASLWVAGFECCPYAGHFSCERQELKRTAAAARIKVALRNFFILLNNRLL